MKKPETKFLRGSHSLAALLSVALFISSSYGKTAVPVFLLFGQSNMVSMASVSDLTADQKKTVDNVMINAGADCDQAKKGKWLPPSSNNGKGGTLYTNMITHLDAAMKSFGTAFDSTQYTPRWAGLVWLQGETDAMSHNQSLANAYETNLGNLIKDIRTKVATPDLPVILPMITTLSIWTYNAKVRGADLVMKQNLKNVDTVETENYPTPDGMHYNAVAQLKIGQISALRWLALHYNYDGTVPIDVHRYSTSASPQSRPQVATAPIIGFDLSGRKSTASSGASGLRITSPLSKTVQSRTLGICSPCATTTLPCIPR
ncbi:MAG: hypothetical protein JW913_12530 [Chitinispirillaceae bacterium]|nr:hypothetical protein [Chitinispirillaceae bacterium]